jgi:hypothetical protein
MRVAKQIQKKEKKTGSEPRRRNEFAFTSDGCGWQIPRGLQAGI